MLDQSVSNSRKIYPVILAGGAGTRLWPMSRTAHPKQLLPILSPKSCLLQETIERTIDPLRFHAPIIVAGEEHRVLLEEKLRESALTPTLLVLEPVARGTAAALAAAATWLRQRDPDALMLVMPAEHVIRDNAAFLQAVAAARSVAYNGLLVTFGITATFSISMTGLDMGFGYIRHGAALDVPNVFEVGAIVDTPAPTASDVATGDYSWNSGIFLFTAGNYLRALEGQRPDIAQSAAYAVAQGRFSSGALHLDGEAFTTADSLSIECAVMGKTSRSAVITVDMGWSDTANWNSVWADADKAENGTAMIGDVVAIDCHDSYLRAEKGLLTAIGVKDLIVVATTDAILVADKNRAKDVNRIVEQLAERSRPEPFQGAVVRRPWGTYQSVHAGPRGQVKHIVVAPGGRLSSQLHYHRAEHWIILRGTAKVTCGTEQSLLGENQSVYIPVGTLHRLENPGLIPLHLIEVQSGSYLGEDDIVRFEDDYGRVEPLPAAATAGVTNVGVASTGVAGNIVEYVDTHEQL